jgi:hypothetical protein
MVQSFVSTQKQSVQRSMTRKFAQFVSTRGDNFELVLTVLRGMLRDQERLVQASMMPDGADASHVTSRCFVVAALGPAVRCAPANRLCRPDGRVHCHHWADAAPHNCAGAWKSGCGNMAWSTSAASTTAPPLAAAASRWSPPTTLQSVSSCTPEDAAGQLQPHADIVIMSIENRSSTAQLAAAHLTPILLVTFKHPTLCLTSTPCGLLFAYVLVS